MVAKREWVSHLKEEADKEDFFKVIKASNIVRNRLVDMIDEMVFKLNTKQLSDDYSSPSWSYLQADRLGQLKSLSSVRRLLQLEDTSA